MKNKLQSILSMALAMVFLFLPITEMVLPASAAVDAGPNVINSNGAVTTKGSKSTTTTTTTTKNTASSKRVDFAKMSANIKEYAKTNKDVQAWLTIPGSNMDMPIILGGKDNYFYGNRTWAGKHYPNNNYKNYVETATYLDYRTKIGSSWNNGSKNFVIYGHNWTNLRDPMDIGNNPRHTMFGQLPSYVDMEYLKANPYVYFSTEENEGIWKIFSVAYIETDAKVFNHNSPNPTTATYKNILQEYKARSLFNTDVEVSTDDKILTLSTCTRKYPGIYDAQRFVVVARLLRPGETENDPITVTVNPNPKLPNFV